MAGFKTTYPGCRITILVNSAFTEVCRGIPYIDNLIEFDMKGYLHGLLEKRNSLVENYKLLDNLVNTINEKEYDLAINVTHSAVSAILVSLIRTNEIRGFTISSEGHRIIKHPWVRYFFNVIPNRNYNLFHIVDMYLKIGNVRPVTRSLVYHISPQDEEKSEQILAEEGLSNEVLVGFHLGASKDDKTWPVSSYAKLADLIYRQRGTRILLFGTQAEASLASEFETYAEARPVNLVGRTGLGELASLLKRCSLFISNDTGPLHIATSAGTTVIDISMANVHFMETGPFGEGHFVIQADLPCSPCGFDVTCNNRVCTSLVTPKKVFEIVKMALNKTDTEPGLHGEIMDQVQVYRSHFKEDGHLGFIPLIKRSLEVNVIYRMVYRQVLNSESNKIDSGLKNICECIYKDIAASYQIESIRKCLDVIRNDLEVLNNFISLTGNALCQLRILHGESRQDITNIKLIKEIWGKIEQFEHEIGLIGDTHQCFRPLTLLVDYSKEALEGDGLEILAQKYIDVYADLLIKAENMQSIISRLIMMHDAQSEKNKLAMMS
jgi:ADP-heptose:LPS heptosyltransferase